MSEENITFYVTRVAWKKPRNFKDRKPFLEEAFDWFFPIDENNPDIYSDKTVKLWKDIFGKLLILLLISH